MKTILGLDLGTNSIGWALVEEAENEKEASSIVSIGVRVNPLTTDEQINFEKGKPFSVNAERTLNRGARRNLDRFKDRRSNLIEALRSSGIISEKTILTENGKDTTHSTWELRSKAARERIDLDDLARVLLAINKKRGYKSSRKAKSEDEGQLIDGMSVAKKLYEEKITPGQFVFNILQQGKKYTPDFYRSDLQNEYDKIWSFQKSFHPEILTDSFYKELEGKGQRATSALFWTRYSFNTADIKDIDSDLLTMNTSKFNLRDLKKLQCYKWRSIALTQQLEKEQLATVISDIRNNLNNSSGYLGAISDRSKELFFNKLTVGQYLYSILLKNPHSSLKNKVFYRQDYLDEFESIWTIQSQYHTELTNELKEDIRDIIIFYQRKLKSQKGLISFCEFESKDIKISQNGKEVTKTIGSRVAPRSSQLFQEFKIWQNLNNVEIRSKVDKSHRRFLSDDEKQLLFNELNVKGNIKSNEVFKVLKVQPKDWEINYTQLEGNKTNVALYNAYLRIVEAEGYDVKEILKVKSNKDDVELAELQVDSQQVKDLVRDVFKSLNIDTRILDFNAELEGSDFEKQKSYQLWHLLYSYEGDDSTSGNEKLYTLLQSKFGFSEQNAQILANIAFIDDYGSLSTKAMRKIFPFIKENQFSTACELAGYRHSKHSLNKEEIKNRVLKNKLEILKKNSLRQPVVEKILNQMVNVVNSIIDKENDKLAKIGKPQNFHFDEIRIELARELKNSAEERDLMTKGINEAKTKHEKIYKILQTEFSIKNPTRNDIIRYRLYEELKNNGYKDLYTDTYIPRDLLFSKNIDIEHIIPQSKLFDDSFSNKTVVYRKDNLDKGNMTAYDYINSKHNNEELDKYIRRVENLFEFGKKNKDEGISRAKYLKLLKKESEIGDGFIERDLRQSQYIAKKAKEMLFEITPTVVSTTGRITDRLREDWGLINIMKELNLPKYRALEMTEMEERKFGQHVEVIKDWTKRNDHRHHAMDALTVAFTKHNHIQYLNYLNARKDEKHKQHYIINAIEEKETEVKNNDNGGKKRVFKEPISNFRQIAKEHLEQTLISYKAKNKVVTINRNKVVGKNKPQITLTPRGQLHKETIYGKYHFYNSKEIKVNARIDIDTANMASNPVYKQALLKRLSENGNDPKKAFSGKNAINKTPIYVDEAKEAVLPDTIKIVWLEQDFSIRKDITPDNFKTEKIIEKVIDSKIRFLLLERLRANDGDAKKAFSDLEKNPIWLNKEKGISIKRVAISGVKNAVPLHNKKDHKGNLLLDDSGKSQPSSFVSTGNNHHVAIYRDKEGGLQERVVSFFEAVVRVNNGLPVIFKDPTHIIDTVIEKDITDEIILQNLPEKDWEFLFTMKQNEMFVFPNEKTGFNPSEIDLLDPKNKKLISPNLFRVQKIATKNYMFNHHLETISIDGSILKNKKELSGIMYNFIQTPSRLIHVIKVKTNHLGDIVSVGEY